MRVTSNEKLIKQRRRYGTYSSLAGLGVLVIGMIASFQPNYLWVSMVAIVLGFALAQFGSYNLRRWGRSPRPDQVLANALKGFDDRYHLFAWALKAPFVLLTPHGIYSFVTRDQTGAISVEGSTWRSKRSLRRLLMLAAQEGLGNPSAEAMDLAERLEKWIREREPEGQTKVQPVVVFIDERAQLTIKDPLVPVVDAKGLKKWLRGAGKGENLPAEQMKRLEALFDAEVPQL